MLLPKGTVFAIADGEQFKLFRNEGTEADPDLKGLPVPELEETNFSTGIRRIPNTGNPGDDQLEEDAHAIAVTEWLNDEAIAGRLKKVVIIADPRSLGEMRKKYHQKLKDALICDLDRTLTNVTTDEIVKVVRAAG
jgi:protein required for attachment to host cells